MQASTRNINGSLANSNERPRLCVKTASAVSILIGALSSTELPVRTICLLLAWFLDFLFWSKKLDRDSSPSTADFLLATEEMEAAVDTYLGRDVGDGEVKSTEPMIPSVF